MSLDVPPVATYQFWNSQNQSQRNILHDHLNYPVITLVGVTDLDKNLYHSGPSDPFAIYADPLDALERATDTRIYNSPDLGNFESAEVVVDMRRKKKKVRVARLKKVPDT